MLTPPTTIADIDKLIADEIQEDLHLDYKQSPALDPNKKNEIAKDVSAFANSDGGLLIYGIVESNNLPVSKDGGVDHTKFSRERLEQIISANITPRIDGISHFYVFELNRTKFYQEVSSDGTRAARKGSKFAGKVIVDKESSAIVTERNNQAFKAGGEINSRRRLKV